MLAFGNRLSGCRNDRSLRRRIWSAESAFVEFAKEFARRFEK